jgi:putative membrane protein insertion efficiency factor
MRWLVIQLIKAYRLLLSPWLGGHCRFYPTCSCYAITAIERFGVLRGSALAARRLSRCHPWHVGGIDPVPDKDVSHSHG